MFFIVVQITAIVYTEQRVRTGECGLQAYGILTYRPSVSPVSDRELGS
jgi:hypothetical protein